MGLGGPAEVTLKQSSAMGEAGDGAAPGLWNTHGGGLGWLRKSRGEQRNDKPGGHHLKCLGPS